MFLDDPRCSQMFLDVSYGAVLPPSEMVFFSQKWTTTFLHIYLKLFFSLEPNLFFTSASLFPHPRSELKEAEVFDHFVNIFVPFWKRNILCFRN